MSVTSAPPGTGARAGAREWAGLAVLALPTLLLAVDNSVLFLALPHLGADLRPSGTQLLWIMDVYGFMTAGLLITMGTLGDRIGRRRLLLIGAAAFGAASVLSAYAGSAAQLIAARALLGVAAATLMPSTLALISTMFRDARQRALAIGIFMACFMGGGAFGPVVGGALLERFWWGAVFLLGVPVMLLLLVTGPLLLPEDRDPDPGRLDLASVALSLAAILPFIYGLKELADDPGRAVPYAMLAAGVAAGVVFVRRQRGLADPFLDLRLFRNRTFGAALAIVLAAMVVQGGVYLFVSQYLQLAEGFSPLRAGLLMAIPALGLVAGSLLSPLIAARVRPGAVIAVGLVFSAVGLLLVAAADGRTAILVGVLLAFVGTSPIGALGIDLIVGSAPPEKAGSASGVAETSGSFGISLGIALLGSIGAAVYRGRVSPPEGTPPDAAAAAGDSFDGAVAVAARLPDAVADALLGDAREAFMGGLGVVAAVSAVLLLGLAVLAATLLRGVRPIGADDSD